MFMLAGGRCGAVNGVVKGAHCCRFEHALGDHSAVNYDTQVVKAVALAGLATGEQFGVTDEFVLIKVFPAISPLVREPLVECNSLWHVSAAMKLDLAAGRTTASPGGTLSGPGFQRRGPCIASPRWCR